MTKTRRPIGPKVAFPGRRGGGAGEPAAHPVPPPVAPNVERPLLIDSREVSRLIGLGRTKTFQLMASGELPTIRLGRCVRVPRVALEAWIADRTSSRDSDAFVP